MFCPVVPHRKPIAIVGIVHFQIQVELRSLVSQKNVATMNRLEEKSSDGMQVATHDEYRSASNNDDRSSGQVSCNREEPALANSKTLRSAHNPLEDIPRDRLVRQAREFVQENGLAEHTSLFERAILVAQQPSAFELMQELREEELQALRDEVTRKWHLPKAMWVTTILCSIGAAVQGWDQVRWMCQSYREPAC